MIIEEVKFCPRCSSRLIQKARSNKVRPFCPSCDWVYFADPKVAVAALIEKDGQVLLVRRSVNPHKGLWTLPAGFVDAGEDPRLALERECCEETDLQVEVTDLVDVVYGQEHSRGADIFIVYKAEILSGTLKPGDDVDRAAFFPMNDLPPLAFSTTRRIFQKVELR